MASRKHLVVLAVLMFAALGQPSFLVAEEPGDPLWIRTYGGISYEHGHAVRPTADGGFIAVGMTVTYAVGSSDFWLVKTDADGEVEWDQAYGWNREEIAHDVQQTTDGGYIVTGHTSSTPSENSSIWLMKTDAYGDTLWTRIYGGSSHDKSFSVDQTTDGGYIVAGRTSSFGAGDYDMWLLRTDASGDTLWSRTYGGVAREDGFGVEQTTDGGFILAGGTDSYGAGGSDFWLLKLDADGDTTWTRTYGGSSGERANSVQQTRDGGYVLGGHTFTYGAGGADAYVVKTDAQGDTLWTRTYGGPSHEMDHKVRQTHDGGYIVGGRTESYGAGEKDVYLVRTDAEGDTLWTHTYGGWNFEFCFSVREVPSGGFIALGYTGSFGSGPSDFYMVRVAGETASVDGTPVPGRIGLVLHGTYPNPLQPEATVRYSLSRGAVVRFEVLDLLGRPVDAAFPGWQAPGEHQLRWDGSRLESGIYFYRLRAGGDVRSRRVILVR